MKRKHCLICLHLFYFAVGEWIPVGALSRGPRDGRHGRGDIRQPPQSITQSSSSIIVVYVSSVLNQQFYAPSQFISGLAIKTRQRLDIWVSFSTKTSKSATQNGTYTSPHGLIHQYHFDGLSSVLTHGVKPLSMQCCEIGIRNWQPM